MLLLLLFFANVFLLIFILLPMVFFRCAFKYYIVFFVILFFFSWLLKCCRSVVFGVGIMGSRGLMHKFWEIHSAFSCINCNFHVYKYKFMVVESNFRRDIENTMQCRNSSLMRIRMGHMQNDTIVIMQLVRNCWMWPKTNGKMIIKQCCKKRITKIKTTKLRLQVKGRKPKSKLR